MAVLSIKRQNGSYVLHCSEKKHEKSGPDARLISDIVFASTESVLKIRYGKRFVEEVSLRDIAAVLLQDLNVLQRLNAFGDTFKA